MDCVFCRIVSGSLPGEVVYSGDQVIAILDAHPIHPGHALVIPRRHVTDLLHLPDMVLPEMMLAVRTVAGGLVQALGLEGFNTFSNNGPVAGQSVFHFHIHITPRHAGDGIRFVHGAKGYKPGEMAAIGERIRRSIRASTP